ncbi:MAG TPA: GAF domain-containing protein [Chloroflexota bacterium]|nr:GAF domain-containing protein [Chloroflexota bacterium]
MPRRASTDGTVDLTARLAAAEARAAALERELAEALQQQTATAEVLRIISGSPTDPQPVFAALIDSAVRLLGARQGTLVRVEDDHLRAVAIDPGSPPDLLGRRLELRRDSMTARAILERRIVRIAGRLDDFEEEYAQVIPVMRAAGYERVAAVAVPLMRDGSPLGAIIVNRDDGVPFSDQQVALLVTFADQAVIAIENARLFQELNESNASLKEALEQQTATGQVLQAISRSPTDLQAVLDTIAESAVRLCNGVDAVIWRGSVEERRIEAHVGPLPSPLAAEELSPFGVDDAPAGRAMSTGLVVHFPDAVNDASLAPALRARMVAQGVASVLVAPLLRDRRAIGAITVRRAELRPFTEQQIALLQTFADQAVIAIENARLFAELQERTEELTRSVERLTALFEVSQAVSSTLDLGQVLEAVVGRAADLAGADGGAVYEYEPASQTFELRATYRMDPELIAAIRELRIRLGETVVGQAAAQRAPAQIADVLQEQSDSPTRRALERAGYRAVLSVPLLREQEIIGALVVRRRAAGAFPPDTVALLQTFASQSALAIQNARLFAELAEKSRQLEEASRHKSEFLANMSHELRTPLNAIIGFSDVLLEKYFGELTEKQEEYLKDVLTSGQHLLALINDILDLSKVEAGRMELELSTFALTPVLESGLVMVRERASKNGVALELQVDDGTGRIEADERKVKQVVFNLLSNAVKFTPSGGRVTLSARREGDWTVIAVADTGVGIAPEDRNRIFEEFGQARGRNRAEGTGLGLTLTKQFVELHGGTIGVGSEVGRGSTFTVRLPVRQAVRA